MEHRLVAIVDDVWPDALTTLATVGQSDCDLSRWAAGVCLDDFDHALTPLARIEFAATDE